MPVKRSADVKPHTGEVLCKDLLLVTRLTPETSYLVLRTQRIVPIITEAQSHVGLDSKRFPNGEGKDSVTLDTDFSTCQCIL